MSDDWLAAVRSIAAASQPARSSLRCVPVRDGQVVRLEALVDAAAMLAALE